MQSNILAPGATATFVGAATADATASTAVSVSCITTAQETQTPGPSPHKQHEKDNYWRVSAGECHATGTHIATRLDDLDDERDTETETETEIEHERETTFDTNSALWAESDGFNTDMTSVVGDSEVSLLQTDTDADIDDSLESIYSPPRYPSVPYQYLIDQPYDTATLNSSARSLYDDEVQYTYENDRRYCGSYFMPNDETEQDRLRVVHQVYLKVFHMELTSVELRDPTVILDIGTGLGDWVLGMAEEFPDCEIIGTDISPIQPTSVPYKVYFEVDDAEDEWMRPPDAVDLVHLRNMAGAFADWSFIYTQAFQCLKPGGYIEVVEFDFGNPAAPGNFYSHFRPDSPLFVLLSDLAEAEERSGRLIGNAHLERRLLEEAGFVDIKHQEHHLTMDPVNDPLGRLWLIAVLYSWEAVSLRLLTKYMGWTADRVQEVCEDICEEFKNCAQNPATNKAFSITLQVVTARKLPVSRSE